MSNELEQPLKRHNITIKAKNIRKKERRQKTINRFNPCQKWQHLLLIHGDRVILHARVNIGECTRHSNPKQDGKNSIRRGWF